MQSPLLTITLGFIAEDKTALDKSPISTIEELFCTHEAGEDRYARNDMTDLGGDVKHVNYYCARCGVRTRTEY